MLKKEKAILSLIDVQAKLHNVIHEKEKLEDNLVRLVKGLQVLEVPILWMEQYPEGIGPTIPSLAELLTQQQPLIKNCFSACGLGSFNKELIVSGRNQVLVCGTEAHVCVYQTVRDLLTEGFEVFLVTDAVGSRTASNRDMAIRIMEKMGAKLTTVEMALFEMLNESGTDQFRRISRIIK